MSRAQIFPAASQERPSLQGNSVCILLQGKNRVEGKIQKKPAPTELPMLPSFQQGPEPCNQRVYTPRGAGNVLANSGKLYRKHRKV